MRGIETWLSKKSWLPEPKSGLIDYNEIKDNYRANSVLEQYNGHIKYFLPKLLNWLTFLEFLIEEENEYVKGLLEQKKRSSHKQMIKLQ